MCGCVVVCVYVCVCGCVWLCVVVVVCGGAMVGEQRGRCLNSMGLFPLSEWGLVQGKRDCEGEKERQGQGRGRVTSGDRVEGCV